MLNISLFHAKSGLTSCTKVLCFHQQSLGMIQILSLSQICNFPVHPMCHGLATDALSSNGRYHIGCIRPMPLANNELSFMTLIPFRLWEHGLTSGQAFSWQKSGLLADGSMTDVIHLSHMISCQFLVYKTLHFTGQIQSPG